MIELYVGIGIVFAIAAFIITIEYEQYTVTERILLSLMIGILWPISCALSILGK
jgi:hypothetical protein